ncbi:MAG: hypothetical protein M1814_000080 [Vezdaea aestivalis]|nr:MAG: hypothetical protein M1814_000080 [Vezdaea aestivalis]
MTATELFAGCWDFTVWAWDIETRASTRRLRGHSDFVKALAIAPRKAAGEKGFLVSGGADASIIVWDLETGAKLRTLKGHGRGIECLIFDDFDVKQRLIWSGGSEREIRNWKLDGQGLREGMKEPLIRHETNIYRVVVDDEGDLWTASADRTVKALARARGWEVDLELAHPDYVRDVLVDEIGGLIVTACRDEEVRVWNRGTGDLVHTFSGHFEEVMGLALLPGQKVVSVSIDGTIRQWSLSPKDLEAAKKEAASPRSDVEEKKEDKTTLTAAEEEELAELMGDAE